MKKNVNAKAFFAFLVSVLLLSSCSSEHEDPQIESDNIVSLS